MIRAAALREPRLQLGEGHLDRVEVGAVGREVEQPGAHGLNALADAANLVGRQVVEHDGVAGLEGWGERVGHIGAEGLPVHRTVEHPRCGDAVAAQGRRDGGGLPVALTHAHPTALAGRRTSVAAGHGGVGGCFIDEHEAIRIDVELALEPRLARSPYIRAATVRRASMERLSA